MARPVRALNHAQWTTVRSATAVIAADSGTLTDANIDPTVALNCWGYDSIFVAVEIANGTSPTMTIEALFRDQDAADGSRWMRLMLGAKDGVTLAALANETTGALAPNANPVELRVFGFTQVFLRVTAVANATSTTSWSILAMPGKKRAVGTYSATA
jgi:hypothetical protein